MSSTTQSGAAPQATAFAINLSGSKNAVATFKQMQQRVAGAVTTPMFFVVGSQRSGTTWVQKLLDAHPHLVCRGEARYFWVLKALHMLRDRYNGYQTVGQDSRLGDSELIHLFQTTVGLIQSQWTQELGSKPLWVGEKTPEHAQFLPMLTFAFPGARVIHIIRDGRDCAVSGWLHANNQNNPSFRQEYPDLKAYAAFAAKNWLTNVGAARQFGAHHSGQYLEVRYEQLHGDPHSEVGRMLRFLDVEPHAQHTERCVEAASFRELTQGRERGEENANSHYRKGIIGDWKTHFDQSIQDAFSQTAGGLLAELGYA